MSSSGRDQENKRRRHNWTSMDSDNNSRELKRKAERMMVARNSMSSNDRDQKIGGPATQVDKYGLRQKIQGAKKESQEKHPVESWAYTEGTRENDAATKRSLLQKNECIEL